MDWNIIAPYIIGGIFSFATGTVGAYLVYKNQRPKALAEARNFAEEADQKTFNRMDAAATRLEGEIAALRALRQVDAQQWGEERKILTDEVRQLNEVIAVIRLTGERQEKEIETLRLTGSRQEKEIETLRAEVKQSRERIKWLEEENERLRTGTQGREKM